MAENGGQCLCGSVRFVLAEAPGEVGLCHCKICRRWAGGLPLTVVHAKVTLVADEHLSWWQSSSWAERGFCRQCGASLFSRPLGSNNQWAVSAGALDTEDNLRITQHIFVDDKADFYDFADTTPRYSGPEFTARMFGMFADKYGDNFLQGAMAKARVHHGDAFVDEVERLLAEKK